jgi:hypothetical protein
VDCGAQQTITQALQEAEAGDTIQVTGTCNETLTISTDRLTLDGQGTATIDGGGQGVIINIVGARGITITGFTIQNGSDGIAGRRGATFTVSNTVVQNTTDDGIEALENSTAQITDCTVTTAGDDGIFALRNSVIILTGVIESNNNADNGIHVSTTATGFFNGATITTTGNGGLGVRVTGTSALNVTNSMITVQNNSGGVGILENSNLSSTNSTFLIKDNTNIGMEVSGSSNAILNASLSASEISDNGSNGLLVTQNAYLSTGNITVQDNADIGVFIDDGSSAAISDSTISGNTGADVALRFGARASLNQNTIAALPISCDGTVLSRGDTLCP